MDAKIKQNGCLNEFSRMNMYEGPITFNLNMRFYVKFIPGVTKTILPCFGVFGCHTRITLSM